MPVLVVCRCKQMEEIQWGNWPTRVTCRMTIKVRMVMDGICLRLVYLDLVKRRLLGIRRRETQEYRYKKSAWTKGRKETVLEKIQRSRLRWSGCVERMRNDRLPFLALHTLLLGTRSRGRQWKRWIENFKEDLEQRGCSMSDATEKWKDRTSWKVLIQPHRWTS